MRRVAAAYAAAPVLDPAARMHWDALIDHTERVLFPRIPLAIERVDDHPYADAAALFADVQRGRFRVSTADSVHPVWTVEQNVKFRAVHDWYSHVLTGANFSPAGELHGFRAHARLLPRAAIPAAFTEVVGQVAFRAAYEYFGEQKVCLLKGCYKRIKT